MIISDFILVMLIFGGFWLATAFGFWLVIVSWQLVDKSPEPQEAFTIAAVGSFILLSMVSIYSIFCLVNFTAALFKARYKFSRRLSQIARTNETAANSQEIGRPWYVSITAKEISEALKDYIAYDPLNFDQIGFKQWLIARHTSPGSL